VSALIPGPGVYEISADEYHADPIPGGSLSSSGARLLLDCAARFKYQLDNAQPPKRTFELGHAAHAAVLGAGVQTKAIKYRNYQTKAAQEERDGLRSQGIVPLLPAEAEQVKAMAQALRAHPFASKLLDPAGGQPEQGLFWMDRPSGIVRRALVDWLPNRRSGRMVIADYKTTKSARPLDLSKAVYDLGYHQQAAWYMDGITALGLADEPAMVFIFQEKTPPYLVTVVELDIVALKIGRSLNRRAIDTYKTCRESGYWPPYSDGIELVPLPAWAEARHAEDIAS
jgi:hypothetical protein